MIAFRVVKNEPYGRHRHHGIEIITRTVIVSPDGVESPDCEAMVVDAQAISKVCGLPWATTDLAQKRAIVGDQEWVVREASLLSFQPTLIHITLEKIA
jgi:hypothetical protein